MVRKTKRMRNHHRVLIGGALALLIAGFLGGCGKADEETPDVTLLHTGRIRGNVYPLTLNGISPLQHYPYLAGYIKKVREEAKKSGSQVWVVDLGDSLEGSFASYATGGANMVAFFNALDYDAIVLGNLDNNVQPELLRQLKAKVLNPFADAAGQPATKGTAFGGMISPADSKLPVYLMANFYGDVSEREFPERFPTWFGTTESQVKPLRDYGPVLASLGARAPGSLTLLSWMKFDPQSQPPKAFLGELERLGVNAILAQRVYGLKTRDVWSDSGYYGWKPPVSENILRNNGGFVVARLDLKRDGNSWRVLRQELLPMTANTAAADLEIVAAIGKFSGAIAGADRVLASLSAEVPEADILQTYATALMAIPGTQAVVYSSESIRSKWQAGELRASEVFNSLPWTNPLVQLNLSPEQIAVVRKNPTLRVWVKAGATGSVTVTTSKYFATLLAAQLHLPPKALIPTEESSEFGYFIRFLKDGAGSGVVVPLPADWSLLPPLPANG